jgi:pyridoxine 5-phosphate synthase
VGFLQVVPCGANLRRTVSHKFKERNKFSGANIMRKSTILLGVNIDHVATLRQARGTTRYPDPVQAAFVAEQAGADSITLHLREDRRHIQERDVLLIKEVMQTRLNFEMAVTDAMLKFAHGLRPTYCCLVPEKREELTTEGGLDVIAQQSKITDACQSLIQGGIAVSLFIDPDLAQIDAAVKVGAPIVEIHTGAYAEAQSEAELAYELAKIVRAAEHAHAAGLQVNAGHGLHYHNVQAIAAIPSITELNIGHAIICQAIFSGLEHAVRDMKNLMLVARGDDLALVYLS